MARRRRGRICCDEVGACSLAAVCLGGGCVSHCLPIECARGCALSRPTPAHRTAAGVRHPPTQKSLLFIREVQDKSYILYNKRSAATTLLNYRLHVGDQFK